MGDPTNTLSQIMDRKAYFSDELTFELASILLTLSKIEQGDEYIILPDIMRILNAKTDEQQRGVINGICDVMSNRKLIHCAQPSGVYYVSAKTKRPKL